MEDRLPLGVEGPGPDELPAGWEIGRDAVAYRNTKTNQESNNRPSTSLRNIYDAEDLWALMSTLRINKRFADGRNLEITAKPLPGKLAFSDNHSSFRAVPRAQESRHACLVTPETCRPAHEDL